MLEHIEISPRSDTDLNVVLIHGFGASMHDLTSLTSEWNLPFRARFLFPNGPLKVELGYGSFGHAWYKIDMEKFQRHLKDGTHEEFSKQRPKGIDEATRKLIEWMNSLSLDPKKTIIGGFSQGAMTSLSIALSSSEPYKGLILFSGQIFDELWVRQKLKSQTPIPVFQSHGLRDTVLSFEGAEKLNELFQESGWKTDWFPFTGGHEIPSSVVRMSENFLSKLS